MTLQGKHIVLGVTGSIAAYKAADIASKLTQAGALVDVVLTEGATEFVTPLTFSSVTHRPVVTRLYDPDSELAVEHVALAKRAAAIVIAPATANTIAKLVNGLADDSLTCTVLASEAPLVIAPAMDGFMYDNPITQENIASLKGHGAIFVGPGTGYLASGLKGVGRLADTQEIMQALRAVLDRPRDLEGRRIVVTAGGTQEPIDPVRVITNRSSGKMGYALAEAARDRGSDVVLVAAPTALPDPAGIAVRHVTTVASMREAVLEACQGADALIMAAAVSDYRPAEIAPRKIKKGEDDNMVLRLVKNPDFFLECPEGVLRVGFAAESENLVNNARDKLRRKGLHLIVANDITQTDAGFSSDQNRVVILDREGGQEALPLMPKYEVAMRILDRVAPLLANG